MLDAYGHHMKALFEAADAEQCGLVILNQRYGAFKLPQMRVPLVTIIVDDTNNWALGPKGFHGMSVVRLLRAAFIVEIVADEPLSVTYRDAANFARSGRSTVIIETLPTRECSWAAFVQWKAPGRLRTEPRNRPQKGFF